MFRLNIGKAWMFKRSFYSQLIGLENKLKQLYDQSLKG